jgi:hypothetical protein
MRLDYSNLYRISSSVHLGSPGLIYMVCNTKLLKTVIREKKRCLLIKLADAK